MDITFKNIKFTESSWIIALILLLMPIISSATHNRSGEITYEQTGPLTIIATMTTYTKASSTSADRDSLEIFWGDGSSEFVQRDNGSGDIITGKDIKVNYYKAEHTYPGRATYTIAFEDPNRVSGILNVNYPNSVDIPFYLETTFSFLNSQFQGENNSAILLQAPIDFACIGERFIHNPNAYDPDGDSLAYELIAPLQEEGMDVPAYVFPDQIAPGFLNQISLNEITGDFIWESPQSAGEYNIAIRIKEYREGVLITSIIRDMQIFVDICDYKPPVIEVIEEICVVAGELIELDILVTDPDPEDLVELTATGGPFQLLQDSAFLETTIGFQPAPFQAKFIWQTTCEHINNFPYQVVFRAQDNAAGGNEGLADLKTVLIKVVGPAPEEVTTERNLESVLVSWEQPYACEDAKNDYFLGFSVWRREGSNPFPPDTCVHGLDGKGYEQIEFLTRDSNGERYFYEDFNIENGKLYCYRILGEFALRSPDGNPYNIVSSMPSEEICIEIRRDFPLLLNVSVEETDLTDGSIFVRWTKPIPMDLDTLTHSGPYTYQLFRRESEEALYNPVAGAIFNSTFFATEIDTSFLDTGINTLETQYYYEIRLATNGTEDYEYFSPECSSIFLSISPSDERNILSWDEEVSWQNTSYDIFRFNESTMIFDSLIRTEQSEYTDRNLINGQNYCYRIKSNGGYGLQSLNEILINYSQESCKTPLDILPPCTPDISIENPCDESEDEDVSSNTLNWFNPSTNCEDSQDASFYRIFYTADPTGELQEIAVIEDITTVTYEHIPEGGSIACYAISAIDSLGNESPLSERICIENCPLYELPNAFTPNNDGTNDLFIPRKNRFIERVNFKLYNRWGNLIYETSDPQINWDGNSPSGQSVDEGVYHYVCEVFEKSLSGIERRSDLLDGFVQLIRSE